MADHARIAYLSIPLHVASTLVAHTSLEGVTCSCCFRLVLCCVVCVHRQLGGLHVGRGRQFVTRNELLVYEWGLAVNAHRSF